MIDITKLTKELDFYNWLRKKDVALLLEEMEKPQHYSYKCTRFAKPILAAKLYADLGYTKEAAEIMFSQPYDSTHVALLGAVLDANKNKKNLAKEISLAESVCNREQDKMRDLIKLLRVMKLEQAVKELR